MVAGAKALPAGGAPKGSFNLTMPLGVRTIFAFSCVSVGLYYLASGKESASLEKMMIGTVLVFASLFFI